MFFSICNIVSLAKHTSELELDLAKPVGLAWYSTSWAYVFYVIAAVLLVYAVVKFRVKQLEKRTRQLEAIVSQRTGEAIAQAERLRELDSMKSRFFANISHEFRTPLMLILGQIESALPEQTCEKTRKKLEMAARNATRLSGLINQLLDLSKIEAASMKLQVSYGNIVPLIRRIAMSFESLAQGKQIKLGFEPFSDGIFVYHDPEKIEKVIINLLSNACKFTPDGGDIRVAVNREGPGPVSDNITAPGFVRIDITDTGIGIPADRMQHVFDRFYQVDSSTRREHEGTGIGLALAKELVELHHGTIEAQSEEGAGSTFIVRLPMGKAHLTRDQIVAKAEASPGAPAGQIERPESATIIPEQSKALSADESQSILPSEEPIVLVVDDNADIRSFIREQLETKFRVLEAGDGEVGIAMAIENVPDLVICDIMMPKKNGYQVCTELKQDERISHVPVIMLTAKAAQKEKIVGLETGADDYLIKPFDAQELIVRVANLIESRRKLREKFSLHSPIDTSREGLAQPDKKFLAKVIQEIHDNISDDAFGVHELTRNLAVSRTQLHRKMTALTNQSAGQFLQSVRLHKAEQLLLQSTETVSEIAFQVGFDDPSYFTRVFRKEFGKSPSQYRELKSTS